MIDAETASVGTAKYRASGRYNVIFKVVSDRGSMATDSS